MPRRAPRLCNNPGCGQFQVSGSSYCTEHTKKRRQEWQNAKPRPSSTKRGYGREWRKIRERVLSEQPICIFCMDAGRLTAANVVDHIDGNSRNNDRANLRSLCAPCHSRRTAQDQGVAYSLHPRWLKPSLIPVTVVCGPPAAGKSRYVTERAASSDLVICLDSIAASIAGTKEHAWPVDVLAPALHERNATLGRLADEAFAHRYGRAWLIVSEPLGKWRRWWRNKLTAAEVVVLETAPATCLQRVADDPDRATKAQLYESAINQWWSRYSTLPEDNRIS